MKLILLSTLLWALTASVGALQCLNCNDTQCSTSVTCSSETMCITTSSLTMFGVTPSEQIFRGCASPSLCPATGNQTFSSNVGFFSVLVSARCCDTDDCNSEALPTPINQTINGRVCFVCLPGQPCSFLLPCEGVEDRCFNGIVSNGFSNITVAGCVSQSICDAIPDDANLQFFQNIGGFISGMTCYEADRCTDVTTTVAPMSAMRPSTNMTSTTPTNVDIGLINPTPNGQSCFFCSPEGNCSGILPCEGEEDMCFSGMVVNGSSNVTIAGCVSQSICDAISEIPERPFFQNIGNFSNGPTCCEGDRCNDVTPTVTPISTISSTNMTSTVQTSTPEMSPGLFNPTPNGQSCFFCTPEGNCSGILPCEGEEDMCFSGIVVNGFDDITVAGCVSQSICDARSEVANLSFLQNIGNFSNGPTCCESDRCNDVTPTVTPTSPRSSTNMTSTTPTSTTMSPGLTNPTPNGQSCFFCTPEGNCSGILLCEGEENMCFSGIVVNGSSNTPVAGCVSQSNCNAIPEISEQQFFQNFGDFSNGPTCCEGDRCNDVTPTVAPTSPRSSTYMTSTTPTSTPEVSTSPMFTFDQHLGLRIRISAFRGIRNTTIIEAVRKYLQENVLNGTDHTIDVISIKEDGSTS